LCFPLLFVPLCPPSSLQGRERKPPPNLIGIDVSPAFFPLKPSHQVDIAFVLANKEKRLFHPFRYYSKNLPGLPPVFLHFTVVSAVYSFFLLFHPRQIRDFFPRSVLPKTDALLFLFYYNLRRGHPTECLPSSLELDGVSDAEAPFPPPQAPQLTDTAATCVSPPFFSQ